MQSLIQNSNNSKRKYLLGGAAVVLVAAVISFSYLASVFSDETPPSLDVGEQGLQGLIMSGKFLQFDDDDFDRADEMDDDSTARQRGVQYFYSAEDVDEDALQASKTDGFEPDKSMTIEDLAYSIKAKKDLQCVIIKWDPEEKQFITFPKGNYKNTIVPDEDELDEYWANSYEGFSIMCSKTFDTWFVAGADEMVNDEFEDDFDHFNLNNFVKGWHLYAFPTSESLKNTLAACPERMTKIYVQTDTNDFEKIDIDDDDEVELVDDWHMVWFKVSGDEDTCTEQVIDVSTSCTNGALKDNDLYICKDNTWVVCDATKQASQVQISGRNCINSKWTQAARQTYIYSFNYTGKNIQAISTSNLANLTVYLTGGVVHPTVANYSNDLLTLTFANELPNGTWDYQFPAVQGKVTISNGQVSDVTVAAGSQQTQCVSGLVDLQGAKICVNNTWVNDTCTDKANYIRYIEQDYTIFKELAPIAYSRTLPSTKQAWAEQAYKVQKCVNGVWTNYTETATGTNTGTNTGTQTDSCPGITQLAVDGQNSTVKFEQSRLVVSLKFTGDPVISIVNGSTATITEQSSTAKVVSSESMLYNPTTKVLTIKFPESNVTKDRNQTLRLQKSVFGASYQTCQNVQDVSWVFRTPAMGSLNVCSPSEDIKITKIEKTPSTTNNYTITFDKPYADLVTSLSSTSIVGTFSYASSSNVTQIKYVSSATDKKSIVILQSGTPDLSKVIVTLNSGLFKVDAGTTQCISDKIVWTPSVAATPAPQTPVVCNTTGDPTISSVVFGTNDITLRLNSSKISNLRTKTTTGPIGFMQYSDSNGTALTYKSFSGNSLVVSFSDTNFVKSSVKEIRIGNGLFEYFIDNNICPIKDIIRYTPTAAEIVGK